MTGALENWRKHKPESQLFFLLWMELVFEVGCLISFISCTMQVKLGEGFWSGFSRKAPAWPTGAFTAVGLVIVSSAPLCRSSATF